MRTLLLLAVLALSGCATELQVVGPYASQLTQSDVRALTALVTPDPDINHLYTRLDAVLPGEVQVKYGGYIRREGLYTSDPGADFFTAWKRKGKWVTDGSAGIERSITVY